MSRLSLYFVLLLFCACSKDHAGDCFKSNGGTITQTRTPGYFEAVEVHDKIDLTIKKGPAFAVAITAGKNMVYGITTSINSGTLVIENENTCNFVRGYKHKISIEITMPYVRSVYNYGVGPVTFAEDFAQDTLFVRAESSGDFYVNGTFKELRASSHGNGDMHLRGTANSLSIYSYGLNYTYAEDFKTTGNVFVSTYSHCDVLLNLDGVNDFAFYLWGEGNIKYTGTPKTISNYSNGEASGQLIKTE